MSEQSFTFPYFLGDKERLFDLGQGIHTNVALILKKNGGKVPTFTQTLRKMKGQSLAFGALAVVQAILIVASGFSIFKVVLAVLCALLGAFLWAAVKGNGQAYERARALYLQNSGKGGTITIDEEGITECSEAGVETHFDWEDYRCCVLSDEAIAVVSFKPVMLIIDRQQETEDGLLTALAAFDRLHTVYDVEIKEEKK